jgi:hypothetical protein
MKKTAKHKKRKSFFENDIVEEKVIPYEPPVETRKKVNIFKRLISKKPVQLGIAALIVLLIVGGGFYQYNKLHSQIADNSASSASDIEGLVAEVGEKMVLPTGETPTLATVSDVSKLQDQPFFKNAQNGDKVLIFGNAKEAIMYRPSIHKIIAVAPVNAPVTDVSQAGQQATPSGSLTPTPISQKIKVVVLNSTKEAGLARKGADLLSKSTADVISTANAVGEYDKTTVSVVSNDKKISDEAIKSLVSVYTKVKPTVVSLPAAEKAPTDADVVIILGSDFSQNY